MHGLRSASNVLEASSSLSPSSISSSRSFSPRPTFAIMLVAGTLFLKYILRGGAPRLGESDPDVGEDEGDLLGSAGSGKIKLDFLTEDLIGSEKGDVPADVNPEIAPLELNRNALFSDSSSCELSLEGSISVDVSSGWRRS